MQPNTIHIHYCHSPVGELVLGDFNNQLCLCDWRYRKMRSEVDNRILKGLHAEFVEGLTPLLSETQNQLESYFDKKITTFNLPLLLIGTDFQQTVWKALQQIDYGKTQTYLGLSKQLNNPKAIRAVASANGANAISIIIPCHRIIGSNQELVGYAGGLSAKKKLLALEQGSQLELFQ
ncbi:MAG TPA: methylated-DNA--[protein]-cysteine S-methyltransferase [Flavobacterium sp.]|uniref:methylated-DNA--[protein]-cysteine S-methyltransferase n=1 Tax=unclassified Flavobacterium TaxID=196869 RepID=UPI000E9B0103|nr:MULTISPECIES: methylated-DNA--[protein]-cysteine S-methyltransferase [unclassified Flavobacterium]HBI01553.1 cysteine methyltransferase [Flavobacterium sp.]HRE78005.1 methylated-DNA--[protein]-cysteine S-methyltransferase [Flavobacterium sp.]